MRALTPLLLVLLMASGGAVAAQEWQGPAALGLEVRGKQRGAVDGALVILRYQQMEPAAGPRPVRTDSRGRAVLTGLAEGVWEVEVNHDDFLSFVALVRLQRGRRPDVQASFLQASGSSLTPMRVRFVDGGGRPPSAPVEMPPEIAARIAARPRPAPAEPAPQPAPEPRPSAPPAPARPAPELRPLPESARPPEPPPPPAPEPPAPAPAPEPQPAPPPPAPEPTPPQPEPPPPPAPEPPAPAPAPEPQPAPPPPAPEPTPPPADAALPPPGTLGPNLRAYRDQTCIECRPGEWALSVEAVAAPGAAGEPCADRLFADGGALAELLGGAVPLELKAVAAPAGEALGYLTAAQQADGSRLLGDAAASCRIVAAVLPKAARFRGLRLEAADASGIGDCLADEPCPVGRARWLGQPRVERQPSATVVWGLFANEAPDRSRRARLTVYFAAPSRTWRPPGR